MDFFIWTMVFLGIFFSVLGIVLTIIYFRKPKTPTNKPKFKYVLSESSNTFHRPECPYVKKIDSMNRNTNHNSYSTLISVGCKPCKYCNPK
jgi:hypothetical protein